MRGVGSLTDSKDHPLGYSAYTSMLRTLQRRCRSLTAMAYHEKGLRLSVLLAAMGLVALLSAFLSIAMLGSSTSGSAGAGAGGGSWQLLTSPLSFSLGGAAAAAHSSHLAAAASVLSARFVSTAVHSRVWWLSADVHLAIAQHMQRYERELARPPTTRLHYCVNLLVPTADLSPDEWSSGAEAALDSSSEQKQQQNGTLCQAVARFHDLLHSSHPHASFGVHGPLHDRCYPSALREPDLLSSDVCRHQLWLAEPLAQHGDGGLRQALADGLNPYPTPLRKHESSRLVLLAAPANRRAELEELSDFLQDRDVRFSLIHSITPLSASSAAPYVWSALYQLPLARNEQQFLIDLHRIQQLNDAPCEQQKFVVRGLEASGLGSQIHSLARMFRQAVVSNRALLVFRKPRFFYIDDAQCGNRSLDCYFHGDLFHAKHRCMDWAQQQWAADEHLLDTERKNETDQFWHVYEDYHWLQRDWEYLNQHRLGMHGPLPALLLAHPRRAIRQQMAAVMERMMPTSALPQWTAGAAEQGVRFLGMHVRHGDKVEEQPLIPFEQYMRQAGRVPAPARHPHSVPGYGQQLYPDERATELPSHPLRVPGHEPSGRQHARQPRRLVGRRSGPAHYVPHGHGGHHHAHTQRAVPGQSEQRHDHTDTAGAPAAPQRARQPRHISRQVDARHSAGNRCGPRHMSTRTQPQCRNGAVSQPVSQSAGERSDDKRREEKRREERVGPWRVLCNATSLPCSSLPRTACTCRWRYDI